MGMYRLHVYDKTTTGMHWQIERGGGAHYHEAEARGQDLPVAVALGTDPVLTMASILPLPEDMDELSFAGFLRGAPTRLVRLANGLDVPADAEIILEGVVPARERRTEGPFGDHFGHYSHAAPFPVFHITKVHRRKNPIYPAAVVGKPPQEDKYQGNAVQEMLLPLLKVMRPELVDLWAYQEAGFHNLAVASTRQRYRKEALKTAFGLLGEGQMSLTKIVVLVDPAVQVRDFNAVLDAVRTNFDPADDFILLPGTSQDTLDFTSFKMNLGSKLIINATSFDPGLSSPFGRRCPEGADEGRGSTELATHPHRNLRDALLVVQVKGPGRPVLERLIHDPALAHFKLIAAVSEDVPLGDDELLLWGLFTRFDCERDVFPARVETRGARAVCTGPLAIDATWKPGYPDPLVMPPDVVAAVDRRGKDFTR
jgi:4-hydroxy-3-polyprenylbenzoate decarboxylase